MKSMKCLIVDDDFFGRELLNCLLADYADVIDAAQDGAEAVALFARSLQEERPYDLVCLDILMPVMNGQEALKEMRRLEKETGTAAGAAVIIMTTALNSVQDIEEAIWEGDCNDYLVKPISQADLLALLTKYQLIS